MLVKQYQVSSGNVDAEVRQQVMAFSQGEIQVTVAKLAQFTRHAQPVQPQRRIGTAGQYQLSGLGRPAFDQIGHVPVHRERSVMEIVHDDRRPDGQLRGVVGDGSGDVGRHDVIHREQVEGIRAELYLGNPKNMGNQLKYADRRNAPCVIIQGSDEKARGEVQIKDLIEGAKAAAAIASNQEWRESRPAQFSCRVDELVAKVREVLARHNVK